LLEILRRIARDHQNDGVQIGRLLVRRYGYAESGQFPMEFADYNDLGLGYLVQRLIEHECQMINEITHCAKQLTGDAEAKQLAQEILASEKVHLDLLTHLPLPGFRPASTSPLEEVTEASLAVPGSESPTWAHPVALSPPNGKRRSLCGLATRTADFDPHPSFPTDRVRAQ